MEILTNRRISLFLVISIFILNVLPSVYAGEKIEDERKKMKKNEEKTSSTIIMGMPRDSAKSFVGSLQKAGKRYSHIKLGDKYVKEGKYDKAIEEYKKPLEENPYYTTSHSRLVDVYEKIGQFNLAAEEIKILIANNPSLAESEYGERLKYLEYASQGKFDLAIAHAKRAYELVPNYARRTKPKYLQRLKRLQTLAQQQE